MSKSGKKQLLAKQLIVGQCSTVIEVAVTTAVIQDSVVTKQYCCRLHSVEATATASKRKQIFGSIST